MKERRKFSGKIYSFDGNVDHKSDAKHEAKGLRKRGYLARVIYHRPSDSWDIWKRKKK